MRKTLTGFCLGLVAVVAFTALADSGLIPGSAPEFAVFTKHVDFPIGNLASVGGGAGVGACCGTACGIGLDNANEIMSGNIEVPSDWDGASDFNIHLHAVPSDSDPVGDTEDIDIDYEYRSIALTETGKQGTAVTGTDTYLQSGGAGAECDIIEFDINVPYTGGNQPLTTGDDILFFFNRNPGAEANSYSGSIIPYKADFIYQSNKLSGH